MMDIVEPLRALPLSFILLPVFGSFESAFPYSFNLGVLMAPCAAQDYENGSAEIAGGFVKLGQSPGSSWLVEGRQGEVWRSRGGIWGTSVPVQKVAPCTGDRILVETLGELL